MYVQLSCFAYSTYCFFEVLVLVAVVASKVLFSCVGNCQTIGYFIFYRPSQILSICWIIAWSLSQFFRFVPVHASQTIRDIYDFEFALLGKIWNGWKAVKSPIVWDFPRHMKTRLTIFADQDTMLLSVSQTIRNRVQMRRDAWVELELPRGSRDSHGSRDSGGYFHMTCTVWPR